MKRESLRPREHGAYGELGFPLVSALAAGTPSTASWAFTAAAVAAFLAHEPLLVVAGLRGPRKRRELGAHAWRRLIVLGISAAGLGALGLWAAVPAARWATLLPALLAVATFALAAKGKERTLPGVMLACTALVSASAPVAVAGEVPLPRVGALCGVWVVGFWLTTAAVRGVAWRRRDGGRTLRGAAWAAGMALLAVGVALARTDLPVWVAAALAPTWLAVVVIVLRPPPPQAMPRVGWSLVSASTATLVVLLVAMP